MTETNAVTMPEDNAETTLTATPSVLICAGEGGIEMGRSVCSLAQREEVAERIQMIAIDSGSGKFEGLDDDIETVSLRTPDRRFHDHDEAQRHYLKPNHTSGGASGSIRQRPLGRYHFDNPERIGSHHDQIRRTIVEFVERFQDDPEIDGPEGVNVFQLVGAGGGTGSGIMPLVTGLLDNVLAELEEDLHPGFEHWAACSLATTSDFDGGGEAPDIHWRYPANTLALLDELRAITGYDDVEYPIRIPLLASKDRSNNRRSAYVIDDNPFSGVFLLRFNQDEVDDRSYREGIGRTTARLVLEWMRKDQDQFAGLENEVEALTHTFFEVRGASFEVPTDRIENLLAAKRKYRNAQEALSDLEADLDELSAAIEQLDVALQASTLVRGSSMIPGDEDVTSDGERPEVVQTAFKRATQVASNITPQTARLDGIKEELGELQDRRTYSFHDRIGGDQVQRAVFLAAVLEETNSVLRTHRFDALLNEFVEHNEAALAEFDASFDPTADPKDQFIQTVKPMLETTIQQVSKDIDDLGLTGRLTDREVYTSKKQKLEQSRSRLRELHGALDERDHLVQLGDAIKEEYDSTIATLESQRTSLAATKAEIESKRKTTAQRATAAQDSVDDYKEMIQNAPLGRFVTFPVAPGAEIQAEHFEDDPGIASLIRDGILDREAAVSRLQETLYDHENGTLGASLETRGKSRSPSQGRPVVFCTEGTHDLVWADASAGTPPKSIATDEFAKQPETVFCEDDHSIGVLAVYGGLSLDNFDHGYLRDSLFQGRATLWGKSIDLEDCYAYPEILPQDHPVSMRSRIENATLPQWGEDNV
ncbi:tubulin-like doman-containing protein [Halorubrum ezzemoulense]|uniref:tubulin-like doman-containing protein n=1 Tax=Halorubrum ezzemoulense TaxID=337243 RepID=UPI00232DC3F7|nr:tubulin-like doman-containing protein [Halorubrum ezzemoulense]MDB2253455.1 tubulin-like doman-containing protein [Halorubrum ezzemoulense]